MLDMEPGQPTEIQRTNSVAQAINRTWDQIVKDEQQLKMQQNASAQQDTENKRHTLEKKKGRKKFSMATGTTVSKAGIAVFISQK